MVNVWVAHVLQTVRKDRGNNSLFFVILLDDDSKRETFSFIIGNELDLIESNGNERKG